MGPLLAVIGINRLHVAKIVSCFEKWSVFGRLVLLEPLQSFLGPHSTQYFKKGGKDAVEMKGFIPYFREAVQTLESRMK